MLDQIVFLDWMQSMAWHVALAVKQKSSTLGFQIVQLNLSSHGHKSLSPLKSTPPFSDFTTLLDMQFPTEAEAGC